MLLAPLASLSHRLVPHLATSFAAPITMFNLANTQQVTSLFYGLLLSLTIIHNLLIPFFTLFTQSAASYFRNHGFSNEPTHTPYPYQQQQQPQLPAQQVHQPTQHYQQPFQPQQPQQQNWYQIHSPARQDGFHPAHITQNHSFSHQHTHHHYAPFNPTANFRNPQNVTNWPSNQQPFSPTNHRTTPNIVNNFNLHVSPTVFDSTPALNNTHSPNITGTSNAHNITQNSPDESILENSNDRHSSNPHPDSQTTNTDPVLDILLEEENETIRLENRLLGQRRARARKERAQRNGTSPKKRRRRRTVVQANNEISQQVVQETAAQVRKHIRIIFPVSHLNQFVFL